MEPFILLFALILWQESQDFCVCHVENEETGTGHVIRVDENALKGHLRHGDVRCSVPCNDVVGGVCNISNGGSCS